MNKLQGSGKYPKLKWWVCRGDPNRSGWKEEGNLQGALLLPALQGSIFTLCSIPVMQVQLCQLAVLGIAVYVCI